MNTRLYIPDKIKVGYQNREGTYTGKLAYVIYYDEKGKLRKENSWNSWRNHDIEPQEFDNIPTEGFVLNKKTGDYSNDWGHRQAYVRVYDPRNFEFEITVENLLYILEHCTSTKGKGLEGEFVYSWDGKDLVLLPVATPDYKGVREYTDVVQENKFLKPSALVVGKAYMGRDGNVYTYMGKHTHKDFSIYNGYYKEECKKFILAERYECCGEDRCGLVDRATLSKFLRSEVEEDKELYEMGLKKMAEDVRLTDFDYEHIERIYYTKEQVLSALDKRTYEGASCLVHLDENYYKANINKKFCGDEEKLQMRLKTWNERGIYNDQWSDLDTYSSLYEKMCERFGGDVREQHWQAPKFNITLDEFMTFKPHEIQLYLVNGEKYNTCLYRRYGGKQLW